SGHRESRTGHHRRSAATSAPRPRLPQSAPPVAPLLERPDTSKMLSWTPLLGIAAPPAPASSPGPAPGTPPPPPPAPPPARAAPPGPRPRTVRGQAKRPRAAGEHGGRTRTPPFAGIARTS